MFAGDVVDGFGFGLGRATPVDVYFVRSEIIEGT